VLSLGSITDVASTHGCLHRVGICIVADILKVMHPTQSNPEDGGRVYLLITRNIARIQRMQRSKCRMDIRIQTIMILLYEAEIFRVISMML
jgi:hypothetical protein